MRIFSIFYVLIHCLLLSGCSEVQQKTLLPPPAYTSGVKTRDGIGKYFVGREIAHMMGPAGIEWLNRAERDREENSTLAINKMALNPDAVVADIGAGSGYYTFKIASSIPRGKVYAVEVQDEMIDYLQQEKLQRNARNVEIIKGDSINTYLPGHSIDLAIMVDVYHELDYPFEIIQSIKKALKPHGKLLLIEYRGEDISVPIKPLHKMTVAQANKEMKACGFQLSQKGDFLPIQHFLLYEQTP